MGALGRRPALWAGVVGGGGRGEEERSSWVRARASDRCGWTGCGGLGITGGEKGRASGLGAARSEPVQSGAVRGKVGRGMRWCR